MPDGQRYPWSLFGDAGGSYTGGVFNVGAHTLTGTPYPADGGGGSAGIAATINFTTVSTVVITNQLPSVTLTNPVNAATSPRPPRSRSRRRPGTMTVL